MCYNYSYNAAKENGVKYKFIGKDYEVHCDMVAGYLRIYDKKAKKHTLLDGTPTKDEKIAHFKIKRREEM